MIGIFIGIASVVSLISLGEGLSNVIESQFDIVGTDVLTITATGNNFGPPGSGVTDPLTISQLEAIERVGGVDFAVGRIIEIGTVEFNNRVEISIIASLPDGERGEHMIDLLNFEVDRGRLLNPGERNKVMVGDSFADSDRFGKPVQSGSRLYIEERQFEVVGVLKKKGSFVVDSTIIMNDGQMRELFEVDSEELDGIVAQVKKGVSISKTKEDIERLLRKERDVKLGQEDFGVETAEAALSTINSTLFAVKLFVYLIAAISLIVGGIGITNTMYTTVLERTDEIGIMKAIGAKNRTIFTLFFIESGFLGIVGGIIGIILGASLAKGLAFVGQVTLGSGLINADVSMTLVIGSLLFSFIVGTISGLLPALKASKMNPVDALRS
ncbi:ABC transporter permease [Candidatus Woesearchaeota archaeon]|nr:ABC transporter permease [Candidatus Woesearchaeota archaeon]